MTAPRQTRYDGLDAVRAGAMLLGLAYHAAYAYLPDVGQWYLVADVSSHPLFVTLVGVLHAFRMQLFFALSGFFSHLVFERRGAAGFMRDRSRRLLVPFAVALPLVLVLDVAVRTWSQARGLMAPTYALGVSPRYVPLHLWFLEYLFLFCLVAYLVARAGVTGAAVSRALRVALRVPEVLLVLAVPTGLALMQHPELKPDLSFVPEPASVLHYAPFYCFGWLLWAARDAVATLARRGWWMAVAGLALAGWVFNGHVQWEPRGYFLTGVVGWSVTLGALGLAFRVRARDQLSPERSPGAAHSSEHTPSNQLSPERSRRVAQLPILRFFVDASYWVYLVHYPLVLALHVAFATVAAPALAKYLIVLSLTFGLALISFVVLVRRTGLGPWLGVRMQAPRPEVRELVEKEGT